MLGLRYLADLRTLFFVSLNFSLVTLAFVIDPWSLEFGIPLFAAIAVTSFQGAVATHNSVHAPVFRKRWQNKIFQVVLTLTYGHPVSSYVPGHNLSHHKHMQTNKDVMRTQKSRFRYNLFNLFFFMLSIAPGIMKADAAYAKSMKKRHPRWHRQLQIETIALWGIQIALFVLNWKVALVFWFIPHIYAQWGIITMNLLQHDGTDETSQYNHSRNFVGTVVNFFTYNNGYHTIHREHPGLHWSLTPEAHANEIAPHIHPNLDQKSLVMYVIRTFLLGKRANYDGSPFVLKPVGVDEAWIPHPSETLSDLGAEGLDNPNELAEHIHHNAT